VDAVVVTYNSAAQLATLLSSRPVRSAFDRVVVVDNGSEDETTAIARAHGAAVLDRGRNDGFAAAVNAGARAACGDRFAVLNPDVEFVRSDLIARLERHLDRRAVGAAAPGLHLPHGGLQDSARHVPSPLDLTRRRFLNHVPDAVRSDRPVEVDWVVAACLIIKREAFDAVGGFDERYFLYFEDVDFAVRLRQAGYRVVYDPTVRALHEHGAASHASLGSWAARQHMRSAQGFYRRHARYLWPRRLRSAALVAQRHRQLHG
jgi:N-acetylglucosaminyl-diphospho-decaprenol L-rhamnosyltransferase